jgi:autotransporter-associated beta strand protein
MNAIMRKLIGYVGLFMSLALAAQATPYWWSGNGTTLGGNGTWDTNSVTHWGPSVTGPFTQAWPNNYSDEAIFTNTAGTIALSGSIKASTLTFQTNNWTLSGGLLDFGSGAANINLTKFVVTLNSPLSGSGLLTVTQLVSTTSFGFGIKLLGNNSNFTGKLAFQAPSALWVFATNDSNFGAVPSVYTSDAITTSSSAGDVWLENDSATPLTILANRGMTVAGGRLQFYVGSPNGGYIVNSRITGPGGVGLRSTTTTFSAPCDFGGDLFLYSGIAVMGTDNALPHGVGKGKVVFNYNNTLNLNGYNLTVNGFSVFQPAYNVVVDNTSATPVTLTVGDANTTSTLPGVITNAAGAISLDKIGTGTTTLQNTRSNVTANAYSGATTVRGGTLVFDRINAANESLSGAVTLAGGTLSIYGAGATTNTSQTFTQGTLTLQAGGDGITVNNRGGNTTLTLGNTWTRANGASLFVSLLGTGTSTLSSSPTLTNGIIGGYAFVKDNTDVDFATVSGDNVVRYTGATLLDSTAAAANLNGTVNYTMNAGQTLSGSATTQTVNSIRLNNVNLAFDNNNKVLVVGSGGIIFSNTTVYGIGSAAGNGTVTAPGGSDLVVYMFSSAGNQNRMFSNIADNNGPVSLVIGAESGSAARLRLNGTSYTYSGDTVVNGGGIYGLKIPYGSGKGNLVINSGGTVDMASVDAMVNGLSASPGNAGGSLINSTSGTSTNTLTVGNGDASATYPGTILKGATRTVVLIKVGTGTQTLSGANTYQGGTILSNGVLSVSSTNNIGGANAKVTFAGGTLRITGTDFTGFGATPLTFTSEGGGLDIADSGNSFTLTNDLASGSVFTKTGAGTLTLTGTQAGTINTDDSSKIGFGAGLGFYNLGILSGGVLSPAGTNTVGTLVVNNNLTLSGKLLVDVTASTSDTVTASGTITLSGAALEIVNPSLLERTKSYTLLTSGGGAVSGSLTALNLPALWKMKAVGNAVVLYFSSGTLISFM